MLLGDFQHGRTSDLPLDQNQAQLVKPHDLALAFVIVYVNDIKIIFKICKIGH